MKKAGGILGMIGGVFGVFAALVTLFIGGVGGAFQASGAGTVVGLGWGGLAFSFLAIIFGAVSLGVRSEALLRVESASSRTQEADAWHVDAACDRWQQQSGRRRKPCPMAVLAENRQLSLASHSRVSVLLSRYRCVDRQHTQPQRSKQRRVCVSPHSLEEPHLAIVMGDPGGEGLLEPG